MENAPDRKRQLSNERRRRLRLDPATNAKWKARDNRRRHEREAELKANDPAAYAELRRKLNARKKRWNATNPDTVRQYRSRDPDVKNATARAWRDKNREYCRARAREVYQSKKRLHPGYNKTLKLDSARARAKRKGLAFDITLEDIAIPDVCPILDIPLVWETRTGKGERDHAPALDRIKNDQGYVKGNVQVISTRANRWKNDMTLNDAKRIVAYMELHELLT